MATLSTSVVEKSLIEVYQFYIEKLETFNEDEFNFKQSPEIWSIAEMYDHVCKSSSHFFLANLVRCLEERKGQVGGEMNKNGENVISYNSFPPMKFKQPASTIPAKTETGSKEDYNKYLTSLLESVKSTVSKIPETPSEYKTFHPAFDWLNSHEWFQMLEIHTKHHLRQLKELEGYARP
ncbi:DinB superfamily protein [Spirosomataceae bacterium TFI 002]|nr:DinB superfamily protein [Spirosomataceae bacterium TFI 002]